jgi:O-antigen ligase
MLLFSGIAYSEFGDSSVFYYHELANQLQVHAVYFSVAVSLSILLTLKYRSYLNEFHKSIFYAFSCFLWVVLFLLSSKTILATTALIYIVILVKNKFALPHFSGNKPLFIIPLLLIFFYIFGGGIQDRFSEIMNPKDKVLSLDQYKYNTPLNGLTLRLTIWKLIPEILKENNNSIWTGTGTGDAQEELQKAYTKKGLYTGNAEFNDRGYLDYNAHNQYLQEFLRNGIIGLIVLIFLVFTPLYLSKNSILSIGLVLTFICFFITESALERQAGNILFTLFISLLILQRKKETSQ